MQVVMVVVSGIHRNDATDPRNRAAGVLKLHRGVVNVEALAEHVIQPVEDVFALRRRHVGDEHMTAQGMRVRSEAPDMQVVNIENTIDLTRRPRHFL